MTPAFRAIELVLFVLVIAGCGASRTTQTDDSHPRDIGKAESLYHEAVEVMDSDPNKAEKLLRDALAYDAYLGKAHNNLGVLLLKQDRLFDAVEAFESARKYMPGHPEPRVNLAIALDRSGKFHEALDAARTALEVRPANIPAIETIALIHMRENLVDDTTKGHLETIATRSENPEWREWARTQLLKLEGRPLPLQP